MACYNYIRLAVIKCSLFLAIAFILFEFLFDPNKKNATKIRT